MFAKTYRVHRIFTHGWGGICKDKMLKDTKLICMVCCLLLVDALIVTFWTLNDPMERHLKNLTLEISHTDRSVVYQPQVCSILNDIYIIFFYFYSITHCYNNLLLTHVILDIYMTFSFIFNINNICSSLIININRITLLKETSSFSLQEKRKKGSKIIWKYFHVHLTRFQPVDSFFSFLLNKRCLH